MTSRSYDTFYYEDEEFTPEEVVDGDYAGPRKIQPENYMDAQVSRMGHSPWIPMTCRAANAPTFGKNS